MEFCPGCGKKSSGICKDCRPVKEILVKDIHIKICDICKRYFYKGIWNNGKLENGIKKIIKGSVKAKIDDLNLEIPILKNGMEEEIEIEVYSDDEIFYIPASLSSTYCDMCKKQGKYYEGVLQLRNANEEIITYVRNYLIKNHVNISDEVGQEKGMDLQLSDKKKLHNLGHELQKKFGGILKVNAQLYTRDRQTSKDKYRIHLYYEAPDYAKGDVLKIENKLILVSKVSKTISGIDLKTGKESSVFAKGEYFVLKPIKTRVSRLFPSIEVLDPETFQSMPVLNRKDVKMDEKVRVVNDNGSYYLL